MAVLTGQPGGSTVKSYKNQQDMPQKPVESQGPVRVHKPRGLQKSHDSSKESERLEIEGNSLTAFSAGEKRKRQA